MKNTISEEFENIFRFLNDQKIKFEIISTKNDLDIYSNHLLISQKKREALINFMQNKSFQLITTNVPNFKGNLILYFYSKKKNKEIVIDIHAYKKIVLKNVIFTYLNFKKLKSNLFFCNPESHLKLKNDLKFTLFPIKFYERFNLVTVYYLLRGCLVIISSNYKENNKKQFPFT